MSLFFDDCDMGWQDLQAMPGLSDWVPGTSEASGTCVTGSGCCLSVRTSVRLAAGASTFVHVVAQASFFPTWRLHPKSEPGKVCDFL